MQLKKPVEESHLSLVLEFSAEIRFTPNGSRLASWRAIGMKDFQFQMWAECGGYGPNCGHSKCQQIDKIVDVIPCTSIEVWGKIEEKKYTIREEDVTYYIFTVSRWEESP